MTPSIQLQSMFPEYFKCCFKHFMSNALKYEKSTVFEEKTSSIGKWTAENISVVIIKEDNDTKSVISDSKQTDNTFLKKKKAKNKEQTMSSKRYIRK